MQEICTAAVATHIHTLSCMMPFSMSSKRAEEELPEKSMLCSRKPTLPAVKPLAGVPSAPKTNLSP